MEVARVFSALKVRFRPVADGRELLLTCFSCGREKLYVNAQTGAWDCKVCQAHGSFRKLLHIWYLTQTCEGDLQNLSEERGISEDTLRAVGIKRIADGWVLPYYDRNGEFLTLRIARPTRWLNLPGMRSELWGVHLDSGQLEVFLCEGEWDAFALMDMGLDLDASLVLAAPGASVWKEEWSDLVRGRSLWVLYDADDAGRKGLLRLRKMSLVTGFLDWNKAGKRVRVEEGMDVRDLLKLGWSMEDLRSCLSHAQEMEEESVSHGMPSEILLAGCPGVANWKLEDVEKRVGELYEMTRCHKEILRIGIAMLLSLHLQRRDPLWMFFVGPAGSGKSEMLRLLADHPQVMTVSNLSSHALVSGWGRSDVSLLPQMIGKLVVFKDFTEMLSERDADLDMILSTLRGAYDGYVRRVFGNGVVREYRDVYFSVAGACTSSIDRLAEDALGERALKYRVYLPLSLQEREAVRALSLGSVDGTELEKLRREVAAWTIHHSPRLLERTQRPLSEEESAWLVRLGFVVAIGRVSSTKDPYTRRLTSLPEAEVPTRILIQLGKLYSGLKALAGVRSAREITEKVAIYSCRPITWRTLTILTKQSATISELSHETLLPEDNIRDTLETLRLLGVVHSQQGDAFESTWHFNFQQRGGLGHTIRRLNDSYGDNYGHEDQLLVE